MADEEKQLKTFKFIWLTGDEEIGKGYDVADAFRRLGYGGGAIRALDYTREVEENTALYSDQTGR